MGGDGILGGPGAQHLFMLLPATLAVFYCCVPSSQGICCFSYSPIITQCVDGLHWMRFNKIFYG